MEEEDRVVTILTLLRRDGKTYTAWTTEIIVKGIEKFLAQQTEDWANATQREVRGRA